MDPLSESQPYSEFKAFTEPEMIARAHAFYHHLKTRRTVRDYSSSPIPMEVIETAILTAGTAPNGANIQPWHFAVITSPDIKSRIRRAAEAEEKEFYERRATPQWLADLAPLGTDPEKPFLEMAPVLIAIFEEKYRINPDGTKRPNYYVTESVGIATGLLITALYHAGLATLTHTPSPMNFLNEILNRPKNEKPFLLLVVGYPAENARVPAITKKPLSDIASFY